MFFIKLFTGTRVSKDLQFLFSGCRSNRKHTALPKALGNDVDWNIDNFILERNTYTLKYFRDISQNSCQKFGLTVKEC